MRKLNIVHVCDHLGWAGSRMHGVKRLFAWMMPRFDRSRFNASLVSLRRKDLSEDTLEQFGIDVTYLGRHKFDPATYTHLLKVLEDKNADVVHLHGYGATTFGRMCAARLGIPAILHEHANHTDTPWFQKLADAWLAKYTDVAIAVSQSTAEFTIRARLMPKARTHVVYLGAPLDEFARPRTADEIAEARRALGVPDGAVVVGCLTRLMPSKVNEFLVGFAKKAVNDAFRLESDARRISSRTDAACAVGDRSAQAKAAIAARATRTCTVYCAFPRTIPALRFAGATAGQG